MQCTGFHDIAQRLAGKCGSNGKCICEEGFFGKACSLYINSCPNKCNVNGICFDGM